MFRDFLQSAARLRLLNMSAATGGAAHGATDLTAVRTEYLPFRIPYRLSPFAFT